MKINIIKRKASSYRDLSNEQIEVGNPKNLLELFKNIMIFQMDEIHTSKDIIDNKEISKQAKSGKISFEAYGNKPEIDNMMNILIQDFEDGLFRIFLNNQEETDLYSDKVFKEEDTLVLIKLVMLSGRLW